MRGKSPPGDARKVSIPLEGKVPLGDAPEVSIPLEGKVPSGDKGVGVGREGSRPFPRPACPDQILGKF